MKDIGKIRERYDFSFDARQLGLVMFGVAAIAALVFVLGVSVGIQWQKKRLPAGLTQQANNQTPSKTAAAKAVPAAPPVLKPITAPRAAFVPASTAGAKKQGTVSLTFPKVLTSTAKNPVAPLVDKKEIKKEKQKNDLKDTVKTTGHYTVQLGAYKDASAARAKAEKLKKKGYDARVYTVGGKRGGYNYKVHVGSFGSKEDAAMEAKKLSVSGSAAPYVTKE